VVGVIALVSILLNAALASYIVTLKRTGESYFVYRPNSNIERLCNKLLHFCSTEKKTEDALKPEMTRAVLNEDDEDDLFLRRNSRRGHQDEHITKRPVCAFKTWNNRYSIGAVNQQYLGNAHFTSGLRGDR